MQSDETEQRDRPFADNNGGMEGQPSVIRLPGLQVLAIVRLACSTRRSHPCALVLPTNWPDSRMLFSVTLQDR